MATNAVVTEARRGRGSLSYGARLVFEVLTLAALMAPVLWLQAHWRDLPVLIPEHFSVAGIADRTGLKSHLWFTPIAALAMYLLLGALSFVPQYYNLPAAPGHPSRPRMEHLAIELVLTLRLEIVTIFGLMSLARGMSALDGRAALGPWFVAGVPVVVAGTLMVFLYEMVRTRRKA